MWWFHVLIQAPADDLDVVVQQIRELIQQLLQQAEAQQQRHGGMMGKLGKFLEHVYIYIYL